MINENSEFTIVFDVNTPEVLVYGERCLQGKITIGTFSEILVIPVECWSLNDYINQWKEGIDRFFLGLQPTCLVTAMRDPNLSDFINVWPIYVDSNFAVLQNQILICEDIRSRFSGKNFYEFVESRATVSEDGFSISEWKVDKEALADFRVKLELFQKARYPD